MSALDFHDLFALWHFHVYSFWLEMNKEIDHKMLKIQLFLKSKDIYFLESVIHSWFSRYFVCYFALVGNLFLFLLNEEAEQAKIKREVLIIIQSSTFDNPLDNFWQNLQALQLNKTLLN